MLGAICKFAQFINYTAHFVDSQIVQQIINCCAIYDP